MRLYWSVDVCVSIVLELFPSLMQRRTALLSI
uniref:Uncharacterized protein n=1 Tax=Arundo donax TaxID=35708 RepID=A0A0A9EII3_ARUDO